jgi:hypothetical protein
MDGNDDDTGELGAACKEIRSWIGKSKAPSFRTGFSLWESNETIFDGAVRVSAASDWT